MANGSEAKIADAMLRELHRQGVLADAGHDLRFSMRPGGNPGRGEFGGVVEAFLTPARAHSRWSTASASRSWRSGRAARRRWPARSATRRRSGLARVGRRDPRRNRGVTLPRALAGCRQGRRFLGPDDPLPRRPPRLVDETLARLAGLSHDDYRYLVEEALPRFAASGGVVAGIEGAGGDAARACALRVLAELRKRVALCDLGDKALSSIEYLTDGGRDADGRPEGGIARLLDAVPPLPEALATGAGRAAAGSPPAQRAAGGGLWARLTAETRDDLLRPSIRPATCWSSTSPASRASRSA